MIEKGKEWELHQKSRTHRKLISRAIRLQCNQQGHTTPVTRTTEGHETAGEDNWQNLDKYELTIFPPNNYSCSP
jgi:hypothetical protein